MFGLIAADAVCFAILVETPFSKAGAILTGNAGYKGALRCHMILLGRTGTIAPPLEPDSHFGKRFALGEEVRQTGSGRHGLLASSGRQVA